MKKSHILLLFTLFASLGATATYRTGYYDAMEGKKQSALKAAAKQCVQTHVRLDYTSLPNYWVSTDVYPDLYNGCKRWWDMYSDAPYLIQPGQQGTSAFSANRMQREHAVPKSWWKKDGDVEYTPAYSDMWNLYPSDAAANQAKSNYAFGITRSTTFDNGVSKIGLAQTGYGGGSGTVFEPADEYKGDFARTIFYMATVYDDLNWVKTYMFANGSYPSLQSWAINMLLDWATKDPVSQKERDRNDAVERCQGNRNPYVDFPLLAEYVWGSKTGTVFRIAEQPDAVEPPPPPGEPEIVYPTEGEALDFGEVAVGKTITRPLQLMAQNIEGSLSLRVIGDDRAMFKTEVSTLSSAILNSGAPYTVNMTYTPTSDGLHEARLRLYDGGLALGKDVTVTLTGHAFPVPDMVAPVALPATEITETGYTARWKAPEEVTDYYNVKRLIYRPGNTESQMLLADTELLEIDDRDPEVGESYSVQACRLGYVSAFSNTILVAAGAVRSVESQPLVVAVTDEGLVILTDEEQHNVAIYDVSGRLVCIRATAMPGETIALPGGIYVVTADGSVPVKAIVK